MAQSPEDILLSALDKLGEDTATAVLHPHTYIELAFIAAALTLALLIGLIIHHLSRRTAKSAPGTSKAALLNAISVLSLPVAALLFFSILHGVAAGMFKTAALIETASVLALSWLTYKLLALLMQRKWPALLIAAFILLLAILDLTGLRQPAEQYLDSLRLGFAPFEFSLLALIRGIVIFSVLIWIAGFFSRTLEQYLYRSTELSYSTRELILKAARFSIYTIIFLITLNIVGIDLTALAVFGGALGVGIGFGLQKITSNFISGIILLMEKSVKVGDLIHVGNDSGWVRRLAVRHTLIETLDGREVLIPNEDLITSRVTNATLTNKRGRIKVEVGVAYGTDLRQALKLILQAAAAHPKCLKDPEPASYVTAFGASGIDLTVFFWIGDVSDGLMAPASDVMVEINTLFKQHGIEIPYPKQDVYIKELPKSG